MAQDAEAKGVDQRVALIRFVEINLARDRRDAEAVAVMRDARDHPGEKAPVVFDLRFGNGDGEFGGVLAEREVLRDGPEAQGIGCASRS